MKILMTGASGLLGKALGIELVRRGHELFVVSRRADIGPSLPFPCTVLVGDLGQGPLGDPSLRAIEGVVSLAGENVGEGRWTEERKRKILRSRVEGTRNLWKSVEGAPLRAFVSASAVGFYGDAGDTLLAEDAPNGDDFLARVCRDWEAAVNEGSKPAHPRKCILRLGVVFAEAGGALDKLVPLFRRGVGGPIGSGKQWMSWIHLRDAVAAFAWAVEDERASGVFNLVAPEPVTNRGFSDILAKVLDAGVAPAVPALALKLALGEQAAMVLASQRVSARKLADAGFAFQFPTAREALEEARGYARGGDELLVAEQYLPAPPEKVFPFFAEAGNLERITPPLVNFKMEKMSTPAIELGTLIDYSLKIHGVPVKWRTEIAKWDPPRAFVDTQLKGPYRKWHHTHRFEKLGPGTLMTDRVLYRIPMGLLGDLSAGWLVRGDVRKIFDYRRQSVNAERFD